MEQNSIDALERLADSAARIVRLHELAQGENPPEDVVVKNEVEILMNRAVDLLQMLE